LESRGADSGVVPAAYGRNLMCFIAL